MRRFDLFNRHVSDVLDGEAEDAPTPFMDAVLVLVLLVLEILKGLLLKMLQLKVDKEFIVKTLVSYGVEKLTTVSEQERFKESVKQIVIGYEYKNSNQK